MEEIRGGQGRNTSLPRLENKNAYWLSRASLAVNCFLDAELVRVNPEGNIVARLRLDLKTAFKILAGIVFPRSAGQFNG